MPKFTAVLRTCECSKYDGSTHRTEVKDLLDEHGQHLDEAHPLWAEEHGEQIVYTDNPLVYGMPEPAVFFGRKLDYDDLWLSDDAVYDTYETGETNYDVRLYRLEFEANPDPNDPERWLVVGPPATLVATKVETSPEDAQACVWFAYFDGTPGPADFDRALEQVFGPTGSTPAFKLNAAFGPHQYQDTVADRAGLQRWFLCQAI